jgi:hypothetical protein
MVKLSGGPEMTIERIEAMIETAKEILEQNIIVGKVKEAYSYKNRSNVISEYVNKHGNVYYIVVQGMPPQAIIIMDKEYQDLKLSLPAPVGISVE